ncbi:MAG: DUF1700 domain-containing protein [Eubacteriales bacterium]|nr:DUF1700 domain-containing protein [Eubacteriales bacterium]
MTKGQYMSALAGWLKRLPKEDFEKAMEYYEEYFQEAGEENVEEAIRNLGMPKEAAEQIIQDLARQNAQKPVKNIRQGMSKVWVGILAVCAVPIAVPVIVVILAVLAVVILGGGGVLVSIVIVGAAGLLGGAAVFAASVALLFVSVRDALVNLGAGLLCCGISLWIFWGGVKLCIWFEQMIVKMLGRMVKKGGHKCEK